MQAAFRVMKECKAERRILVAGDISDFGNKRPRNRLKELGKTAQQIADLAVFIGPHARYAVRAGIASGMKPDCIFGFTDLRRAAEYLRTELRSGDLVLLRGRATEHLSRVFFAQFGAIGCWKTSCRKTIPCDFCPELRPSFDLESIDRVPAGSGGEPRRSAGL
jgi:UDP-N-acetylmuramoyl-tripeptide--D-alanyl-D-alanine ligase